MAPCIICLRLKYLPTHYYRFLKTCEYNSTPLRVTFAKNSYFDDRINTAYYRQDLCHILEKL